MMQRGEFHAMGSRIVAVVDGEQAPDELDSLPGQFEAWEQCLSRFRNDSELCELNRRAGMPIAVSQVLWDVFEAAREADRRTGGLVNPLIMDALVQAGYDRSFDRIDTIGDVTSSLDFPAVVPPLERVIAHEARRTIHIPAGMQLDFGGVAKGWAAEQSMLSLRSYGPALVGAGGDIAISAPRLDGEPWEIAVDDPFQPDNYMESLFVEQGGIATSGRDYRRWTRAGIPQHHIIDPRTGLPADTDILAATIIAPSVVMAEAIAKAVLILGSDVGLSWLEMDESLAGLLVLQDGRRLDSRSLDRYL